jgi:coenzyme F420-reducing hydrogenase delta subunit
MIDLTQYQNIEYEPITRVIMTCFVRLDKDSICDVLKADSILINGKLYEVPRKTLLNCLELEKYGEIKISFTELL